MMLATPVRSSEWSSTTNTRALAGATADASCESAAVIARPRNRERRRLPRQHHFGAGTRRGDERQRGADAFGPFAHDGHAESRRGALARNAHAVVGYRQPETDAAHRVGMDDDAARP